MLVPLTDSNNPYAVMMIELIDDQKAPRSSLSDRPASATLRARWVGIRGRIARLQERRRRPAPVGGA